MKSFSRLKSAAQRYARAGCSKSFDAETNRRVIVVNLFAFVGSSLTLVLGVRAAFAQDWLLGLSLAVASLLFFTTRWLQVVKQTLFAQHAAVVILVMCLMVLTLFLVITGGNSNTGPLWLYLVPPVSLFLGGFKRGLTLVVLFTALVSVVLFYPNDGLLLTHYSVEFKTRLLYSFATIVFLSGLYEYSREQSYAYVDKMRDEFEHQALHDQMTKLPNRRHINEQLKHEYQRMARSNGCFSVLLADVDHFKSINDQYGHDCGDEVLKTLAKRFQNAIRKQDMVARWGGEEFLFMLPDTGLENAHELAEKIRLSIHESPVWQNQHPIKVALSIGVAEVNKDTSIDQAVNLADKHLYMAKHEGRNRVVSKASGSS
ncbi:GGDEF domain-containing protein [Alteromonas oceanisediminis]|uniref:GGDEF domain-containing protein n=1 Tax=Alteromonas oceanisediminis TaxID=2836180 RepID=UPI001BDACABB|nr:GGDEF domain-containing protein [Alteromonas oceanisediminis]MBT0587621.1 GGDEF domain-containing protein [Alteromonas oceanisediminis]